MYQSRPPAGYPCKTADKLVLRFAALGFAKVFAVRAKPGKTYRMTIAGFHRIYLPHILTVMLCVRVISLVHPDSFRIMVNGNIYTVAGSHLYPGAGSASAGKVVNDQFSVNHLQPPHFHLSDILYIPQTVPTHILKLHL